jgi:hypothetical protein
MPHHDLHHVHNALVQMEDQRDVMVRVLHLA